MINFISLQKQIRMECVICYEKTQTKTDCNHRLCSLCIYQLEKNECPYCRTKLSLWKNVKIPFYFFVKLFDELYKDNIIYKDLKDGIAYDGILDDKYYYVFEEKYAQSSNYNEAIEIRIYNILKTKKFTRMEFNTVGLDQNKRNRFFYNFHNYVAPQFPYLEQWINKNLNTNIKIE